MFVSARAPRKRERMTTITLRMEIMNAEALGAIGEIMVVLFFADFFFSFLSR